MPEAVIAASAANCVAVVSALQSLSTHVDPNAGRPGWRDSTHNSRSSMGPSMLKHNA
jgi:hypothetical protein